MLCIGHRGAAGHAPENTIAAVRKGIELGANWIEIDVYCVEGQLIAFHDDRLERTTNGKGFVMEQSFEYLRSLDAGQGERIPTLSEIFETLAQAQRPIGLNIELKGPGTASPVVEFLSQQEWTPERLTVSSFQLDQLRQVRSLNPQIPLGLLYWKVPGDAIATAQSLSARSLNLPLQSVTAERVQAAQAEGLQIWVYTVNEVEDLRRMRSLGIDGVFTDYPDRAAGA